MVNVKFVCIVVLLVVGTVQSTDKCVKSRISNNELSKAFYSADPNPKIGYMTVKKSIVFVTAYRKGVSMYYNTWLSKDKHDARTEMSNLWSHLTHMIVSNTLELYAHYEFYVRYPNRVNHQLVNYDKIKELFDTACSNWNSVKNSWPYNCLDAAFFCHMSSAMAKQKDIVVESGWDLRQHPPKYVEKMKLLSEAIKENELGTVGYPRTTTLDAYFAPEILKFIPESTQEDVFYHSKLTWKFIAQGIKRNLHGLSFAIATIHSGKCNTLRGQPVAVKYYCKVEEVKSKFSDCNKLSDATPCIYDRDVQEYFNRGRFRDEEELNLLNDIVDKTKDILTEFKDKAVANDRTGLSSLYNKFKPRVTVDDSMCVADWPNAFNCTNNIGCRSSDNSHKFDCNGGYTCRINMMYRFDCLLKFVLKQTKQFVDASSSGDWNRPSVQKAKHDLLIWLSYLPMAHYTSLGVKDINDVIMTTQRTVNGYVTNYDTKGLKTFATNLPAPNFVPHFAINYACQVTSVANENKIFCNLEPLLTSVYLFINAFENSKQSTSKALNPTVNYPALLGQLQLDRVGNYINLQTQGLFNGITNQLKQNFGALSNYFSSLANYDKTKADADIAYITGRLDRFRAEIINGSHEAVTSFNVVFGHAVGANVLELAQRATELGIAIAQVCNPTSQLFGGSSLLDLAGTINELAQAGVTTAIIARLHNQDFPDLIKRGTELATNFKENEKQQVEARRLIEALKHGTNAQTTANNFLVEYNNYDPKVLRSDITAFGAKWETVAEQLCEAAFSSGTALAAVAEISLASKGDCYKIGASIAKLITLYEELFDYQFDLMDSLSDAARAYLAYQKATDLKLLYTSGAHVDQAFLRKSAVNTFMVSTLNIWEVVTEYCDILTYTRGGEVPDKCETALRSPTHHAIAQVISYQPNELCHVNNEITDYRNIPTKPANSNDKAYIDLDALYARKTVDFQVPNFQWLKDNGWVGPQDREKAMYIKRFELFLTPMSGSQQHTVELQVVPSVANYLRHGGTKYLLPVTGYTARYTENSFNCYHTQISNPYALCRSTDLEKLCITSNGYVNRKVQPSIYNKWTIRATSLPTGQAAPRPSTNFKLQAAITMCVVNLSPSVGKREISRFSSNFEIRESNRTRRSEQHCCSSSQYWTGSRCSACPSGSRQKLHGYYCQ